MILILGDKSDLARAFMRLQQGCTLDFKSDFDVFINFIGSNSGDLQTDFANNCAYPLTHLANLCEKQKAPRLFISCGSRLENEPGATHISYRVAKAGHAMYLRCLQLAYPRHQIVNYDPGYTRTKMWPDGTQTVEEAAQKLVDFVKSLTNLGGRDKIEPINNKKRRSKDGKPDKNRSSSDEKAGL